MTDFPDTHGHILIPSKPSQSHPRTFSQRTVFHLPELEQEFFISACSLLSIMTASPRTEEGRLTTSTGDELFTKTWHTASEPKARIVWLHGFSDHCGRYENFFLSLLAQDIKVYSFDQRGWGRSVTHPKEKGATGGTDRVLSDITEFIQSVLGNEDAPMFLGGHSMGGGEAMMYTAAGPAETVGKIRGLVLESPFLKLPPATRSSPATLMAGRLASRFVPKMQLVQKLDKTKLSRDPSVNDSWEHDPLCHNTGTLEGLTGMLDRGNALAEGRVVIQPDRYEDGETRLWVGHGTADGVVDYDAVKRWFDGLQVGDKQMVTYDGWYHQLHNEPGEDQIKFASDVSNWILERSRPESREAKL